VCSSDLSNLSSTASLHPLNHIAMKSLLLVLLIVSAIGLTVLAVSTNESTTPTPTPTPSPGVRVSPTATARPASPRPTMEEAAPWQRPGARPIRPTAVPTARPTSTTPKPATSPSAQAQITARPITSPSAPPVVRPSGTPIVIAPIQGKQLDVTTPIPGASAAPSVDASKMNTGLGSGVSVATSGGTATKITVTGLPREFHSGQVIEGKLLCPKFSTEQGASGVLVTPCVNLASDELKKHSFSRATALGPAAGKDCATDYKRLAGLGPAFADTHVGGQCWACPAMMDRNLTAAIDSDKACTAGNDSHIVWQSAQYPEPGVAAFIKIGRASCRERV